MKTKRNPDIKQFMKTESITQYDLGLALGVSEQTVYRLLSHKLSDSDRTRIETALSKIIKEMQ